MNTHSEKNKKNKSQSVANRLGAKPKRIDSTFQLVDNRPEAIAQRKLQDIAHNSSQARRPSQLVSKTNKHSTNQHETVQKKASPESSQTKNKTGLPDNLKSGIENLSGYSMDDVKVHYNSSKPAQMQAHAFAQGTEIHLGSGQEKHLPHEAWHVVQQKQGRVKPTIQREGVAINDNPQLEQEATTMGSQAVQMVQSGNATQLKEANSGSDNDKLPYQNMVNNARIVQDDVTQFVAQLEGDDNVPAMDLIGKMLLLSTIAATAISTAIDEFVAESEQQKGLSATGWLSVATASLLAIRSVIVNLKAVHEGGEEMPRAKFWYHLIAALSSLGIVFGSAIVITGTSLPFAVGTAVIAIYSGQEVLETAYELLKRFVASLKSRERQPLLAPEDIV